MPSYDECPQINFTFSRRTILEIEKLRQAWIKDFPSEEPDIVSVGWAYVHYNNGRKRQMPMISFYLKSMRPEIERHIQMLCGLEVIFFTTEPDARHFAGKILDFSEEQGFFLRAP
ncbi:MAG: hypothetical protein O9342_05600 [Beijerinckiaceae bacterium]|nr:hypothetical protein [Beijerinckiaceae bacterium]